jgi:hypothetical protein
MTAGLASCRQMENSDENRFIRISRGNVRHVLRSQSLRPRSRPALACGLAHADETPNHFPLLHQIVRLVSPRGPQRFIC